MQLTGVTVLAVDDDQDSLDLICESLRPHGCDVICATSGPDAVKRLRKRTPDVVVLDIMMPDMNGFALLDVIRGTAGLEDVPVILETADPSRAHGQRAVESGLTYMLAKPLDVDLLVRAVASCSRAKDAGVRT